MKSLSISAIAIGLLAGVALPYAFTFTVALAMAVATGERSGTLGILFTLLLMAVAVGAPVLGGYVAARRAKIQPLLHGFAVGILGAVAGVVFTHSVLAGAWAVVVWMLGGICGGWLWRRSSGASGAL